MKVRHYRDLVSLSACLATGISVDERPVNSLPPEILSHILLSSIPPVVLVGHDGDPPACFPWVLTHVCRRWRNTALAFPKLWAFTDIRHTDDNAEPNSPTHDFVKTYLARSGRCPLSLCLRFSEEEEECMHPIMETLLAHSERWEEVYLVSPSGFAVDVLSKRDDVYRFPLLRRFNCTSYHFFSEPPDGAVFQSIPFAQLERYQEYVCSWHLDPERSWEIVSQLTQADTLRIAIPTASESVIKLPRLRVAFLAVDFHEALHLTMDQVLGCFDLPRLEALCLSIPRSVDVLCPVPKQFQSLKVLRLCGSQRISNETLTDILSHIPTLTDFGIELYHTNTDARHLIGLLRPKPESVLLPRLQALRITPPKKDSIVDELLAMLRERFAGVEGVEFSRLRIFSVYHIYPAALPDALLEQVESLKAREGWDIRVDRGWHGDFWEDDIDADFL